tara:strand:- start:3714 stop:4394 length:681 start_codon:yes stop_codon:yes gene_type:complete
MKLSDKTIETLKNFSSINPNLVVREGNELSTISEAKNIMASTTVSETFDKPFGIYDLNEFLSAVSLIKDSELEFTDNAVKIKNASSSVDYRFANIEILTAPAKSITMPESNLSITITDEVISEIRRAGSALGHPVLSITNSNSDIIVKVCDPSNPTANTWSKIIQSGDKLVATFDYQFLISNLKLVPGDYEVNISNKLISSWKNTNTSDVEYWIALEKTSTYEDKE